MTQKFAKDCNGDTFVKITNLDIYQKLCDVEAHVIKTNGKVKRAFWVATSAMSLTIILLGFLFQHMNG